MTKTARAIYPESERNFKRKKKIAVWGRKASTEAVSDKIPIKKEIVFSFGYRMNYRQKIEGRTKVRLCYCVEIQVKNYCNHNKTLLR